MAQDGTEDIPGYRDLVRIGQGGFSAVYRAYQEAFDRQVAVKVLMVGAAEAMQRRFLREAKLTGRLSGHPNIVTALDAGMTWSGRPYLTTALHERGSLHDRLVADGPFAATEVADIGSKIADALAAAHRVGIVHRDVKPSNILVSEYGEPALADFGVAYLFNDNGKATLYDVFSPNHVAPEVINGVQSGPLGDIYALGSTLFQLLHGRTPFQTEGTEPVAAVLWRVVNDPTPSIDTPRLPELAAVIAKAMAKEPTDRYADAAALAQALRELLPDNAVATTPAPTETPVFETQTARVVKAPGPDSAPEPEFTIIRPERMIDAPPPVAKRRRWRVRAVAVTIVLLAAAGTAYVLTSGNGSPAATPTSQAPLPSPVATELLNAARPTAVVVKDNGDNVTVSWTAPANRKEQIFLQILSARPDAKPRMEPVANGRNELQVAGLDAKTGYCFLAGAVIAWGTPSVIAWSTPTCIRGAVMPSATASPSESR